MVTSYEEWSVKRGSDEMTSRQDHGIMKALQNNDTYVPIFHHSLNWDNISGIRDDRPW